MLDGLTNDEIDQYLDEHPRIVDVVDAVTTYVTHREDEFDEPDKEAIRELQQIQEALEREMVVSQRVKASKLEDVDLGTT